MKLNNNISKIYNFKNKDSDEKALKNENTIFNIPENNDILINNILNAKKEETKIKKNGKKTILDFKGAFKAFKKLLQRESLMFFCKTCNNFICSGYSIEDILIFKDKNIDLIFNPEFLFKEIDKNFNKNNNNLNEVLIEISNFFGERNISISTQKEISQENDYIPNFIYTKLICSKCNILIVS